MFLKIQKQLCCLVFLAFALWSNNLPAQSALPEAEKKAVVKSVGKAMKEAYLFPETGEKMSQLLAENYKKNQYKNLTNPVEFATRLTADLQSISHDKHIRVFFDPDWVKDRHAATSKQDSLAVLNRDLQEWKKIILGSKK